MRDHRGGGLASSEGEIPDPTAPAPVPAVDIPDTKPGDESPEPRLGLFRGFGVELELMIVDAGTLDVRPVADRLLEVVAGAPVSEVEMGRIAWSNELALHVIELKTNGPAGSLRGLAGHFYEHVLRAEEVLADLGCRLLPGGAHPWMDPEGETRIWPHEYTEVYRTFDRIFSCRGHGWSNLQSTHLNLPFSGAEEFTALHAAVRAMLPLVPALTASTPVLDGRLQGALDARMEHYARNAARIPSVTGAVVPEWVASPGDYQATILGRIYRDLEPLDPEGVLRHEWVNARGAIARFQRGTIEIRVVDAQECPAADLAVTALQAETVRRLVRRALEDPASFRALSTERLAKLLRSTVEEGEAAAVELPELIDLLELGPSGGSPGAASGGAKLWRAGDVWRALAEEIGMGEGEPLEEWRVPLSVILEEGTLARRIVRALGPDPDRSRIRDVWFALGGSLRRNVPFGRDFSG